MKAAVVVLTAAVVMAASIGVSVSEATGRSNEQPRSRPLWVVRYEAGTIGWLKHDWATVEFANRSGERHAEPGVVALDSAQVIAVQFSQKAVKDSDRIQGPRSGCSYARRMMPDASWTPPDMLLITKTHPGLGTRFSQELMMTHPVRVIWKAVDSEQSITLNVEDCEYESLVANLRWMLGLRWPEVSHDDLSRKDSPDSSTGKMRVFQRVPQKVFFSSIN
jgi:hypothetical protein